MRRLLLSFTLAIVLLASACGSRVDWDPSATPAGGDASRASTERSPASTADAHQAESTGGPPTHDVERTESVAANEVAPAEAETHPPVEDEAATVAAVDDLKEDESQPRLISSIEPGCATPGGTVTVVLKTYPFADVAYASSFSDGETAGPYGVGTAGADGTYTWRFTVPLDAQAGEAQVMAVAHQVEQGSQSDQATFRVAQGSC